MQLKIIDLWYGLGLGFVESYVLEVIVLVYQVFWDCGECLL